jgi:hypothetical protein
MTSATRTTYAALLPLTTVSLAFSQGASPTTPSKEYIRLGGSIIAIENAAPAVSLSPTTINFGGQTVNPTAGQVRSFVGRMLSQLEDHIDAVNQYLDENYPEIAPLVEEIETAPPPE